MAIRYAVLALVFVGMWGASSAFASPSYARLSGVACMGCHTQSADSGAISRKLQPSAGFSLNDKGSDYRAGIKLHTAPAALDFGRGSYLNSGGETYGQSNGLKGFSGYVGGNRFLASVSLLESPGTLMPNGGDGAAELWYRFAYTPKVAGLDVTLGVFGAADQPETLSFFSGERFSRETFGRSLGLDAGVTGSYGDMTLDLKTVYLNNSDAAYAQRAAGDDVAGSFSALAQVGFDGFGVNASFSAFETFDKSRKNAATLGAWFNIAEDVVIKPEITAFSKAGSAVSEAEGEIHLRFYSGF